MTSEPARVALPAAFRVQCDPGLAVLAPAPAAAADGGIVLLGGAPLRLMALSAAGARVFAALRGGATVGAAGPGAGLLARRLVDAGLVHPLPPRRTAPVDTPTADAAVAGAAEPAGVAGAAGVAGTGGGSEVAGAGGVTAVIPVRDGAGRIGALVGALRGQCTEVVVVDDGSRDGTSAEATAAGARVIRHDRARGPAAARTAGARAARTELIVFCDCDVRPTADWLDRLIAHLADPAVVAVAPRVASPVPPASRAGLRERYEAGRSPLDLGPWPAAVRPGSRVSYVPSAALLLRRAHAAFDPALRFGEDVDLVWRLVGAGHSVRYEPTAVVHHDPRPTWWAWARQRHGYGSSAAELARRHPGPLRPARGAASAVAAVGLMALRRDRGGAAVVGAVAAGSVALTTARLARRLGRTDRPGRAALALTVRGRRHALLAAAETSRRTWLPLLACAGTPGRLVLAAATLPLAHEWWVARPAVGLVPYLLLRVADDAAYCAGVWSGCLLRGHLEPLLPVAPSVPRRGQAGGRGGGEIGAATSPGRARLPSTV
ncbi:MULTISPECIES: mycofactocin biosynthesis glycosyltransferase MftF [Frankia]|uniref:Glycosyl transferase n=2 Tax=Frankia TaxID=1854 RepID=Q0RDH4_FRAAA|nr:MULTISPECIES: mycofactocin biosynthesis glycosyltransferase MftF [Frankia]CAJ64495.1 Putative glycosyl transferase [Frankia alni ACN14a]